MLICLVQDILHWANRCILVGLINVWNEKHKLPALTYRMENIQLDWNQVIGSNNVTILHGIMQCADDMTHAEHLIDRPT